MYNNNNNACWQFLMWIDYKGATDRQVILQLFSAVFYTAIVLQYSVTTQTMNSSYRCAYGLLVRYSLVYFLCFCMFFIPVTRLFCLSFCAFGVFSLFVLSLDVISVLLPDTNKGWRLIDYQCKWLPGKSCLHNDSFYVFSDYLHSLLCSTRLFSGLLMV